MSQTLPSVGTNVTFDSYDFSACNSLLRGQVYVGLLSQSQASRTSTLRVEVSLYKNTSTPTTDTTFRGDVTLAGPQGSITSQSYSTRIGSLASTPILVYQGNWTVPHSADGSGYADITVTCTYGSRGTGTDTERVLLPTIPVSSALSVSPSTIELGTTTVNYSISAPDSSWYHILRVRNTGGATIDIATVPAGQSSYAEVLPISVGSLFPNAQSAQLYFDCLAYTGSGSYLGTYTVTQNVAITGANGGPTVSDISVTPVTANGSAVTTYSGYIASVSYLKVVYTVTDGTGSSISSTNVSVDGYRYEGTLVGNQVTLITTYPVGTSGTVSVKCTATNARGYSTTGSTNISVQAYSPPNIPIFGVARSDAAGNPAQNSTYARVDYSYAVRQVSTYNSYSITISYKLSSSSVWTNVVNKTNQTTDWTVNEAHVIVSGLDASSVYDFRIIVTDKLTAADGSASRVASLGQDTVIIGLKSNGQGIAFGKVSEYDRTVDFGWAVLFSNGIAPLVIGTGASLNSYNKLGYYYGTFSNGITGGPSAASGNFGLLVLPAGPDACTQILSQEGTVSNVYVRTITNSGQAGSWYKITMTTA